MGKVGSETDLGARVSGGSVRRQSPARRVLMSIVGTVVLLAVWQGVVTVFNVPMYVVPSPTAVAGSLVDDFPMLLRNLWPTAFESVMGFIIGNLFAILLAILFVHSMVMERTVYPLAIMLRTVPVVAIAPVLVLLLGNGYAPKIAIAALIAFFPTLVNMFRGLNAVDSQTVELFRVLSASRWEVFWKLRVYASLPYLFSALKIAATASVIGAIVAEWIGSTKGLGALIINATFNFQTPLLYSTMVVASALALVFFYVVGLTERLVVRWNVEATF